MRKGEKQTAGWQKEQKDRDLKESKAQQLIWTQSSGNLIQGSRGVTTLWQCSLHKLFCTNLTDGRMYLMIMLIYAVDTKDINCSFKANSCTDISEGSYPLKKWNFVRKNS